MYTHIHTKTQIRQAERNNSAWMKTPQNRPKFTGPSPATKTAGIGLQSRQQELKQ